MEVCTQRWISPRFPRTWNHLHLYMAACTNYYYTPIFITIVYQPSFAIIIYHHSLLSTTITHHLPIIYPSSTHHLPIISYHVPIICHPICCVSHVDVNPTNACLLRAWPSQAIARLAKTRCNALLIIRQTLEMMQTRMVEYGSMVLKCLMVDILIGAW